MLIWPAVATGIVIASFLAGFVMTAFSQQYCEAAPKPLGSLEDRKADSRRDGLNCILDRRVLHRTGRRIGLRLLLCCNEFSGKDPTPSLLHDLLQAG
jgi:hypothetical protein